MAKRVLKTAKSAKLTAAIRRTKKGKTPVKKAPIKKVRVDNLVTSGNTSEVKTTKKVVKTPKVAKGIKNKSTKFIKIASNASRDEFNLIGERIKNSEVEWTHFAMDGEIGYHHYRILK